MNQVDIVEWLPSAYCSYTSVVGKLLHKILSYHLEEYLRINKYLYTSVKKALSVAYPGYLNI